MTTTKEPGVYEFGEFWLDSSKRLLLCNSQPIGLTPKVFETLLYLARNAGRVIHKDELMREIWMDTIVEENNLNKNISVLRQTLGEKPGENRFIATVPGQGYKFVAEIRRTTDPEIKRPDSRAQRSVAVLPFKPLVIENRHESLEMGMADTLIARLGGNNRNIVIRPLASVRKYSGLDQDPLAAGRELEVDSVLDGSIQRFGEKIRVNLRLMGTADGTSQWAGTFDESFTDIFALQDAIAERVADALEIELGSGGNKNSTENVDAYQYYVKGRFHVARLTPAEMQLGIDHLQKAIDLDPSYALAYVGLADAYHRLCVGGELPSRQFLPRSQEAAKIAIEIDDSLAEAYTILGWTSFWYDWDWPAAERNCRKALELDPNLAHAHEAYAHLLSNTGRNAEGLAEIKLARELNPTSPFVNALEGQFLLHAGRIDEASERLNRTFELEENFWLAHLFEVSVLIEKGLYAEAAEEAEKAKRFSGGSTHAAAFEAYALAKAGDQAKAEGILKELLNLSGSRYVPPYHIALAYLGSNDREKTFEWLERGLEERDAKMVFLKVEPKWDELRSDSRFTDVLNRMGLI